MRHMRKAGWLLSLVLTVVVGILAVTPAAHAQATVGTGSIRGAVLDPGGNSVPSAKVTITSKETGRKIAPDITSSGEFNSGPVTPGQYTVRIEARLRKVSKCKSARSPLRILRWSLVRRRR